MKQNYRDTPKTVKTTVDIPNEHLRTTTVREDYDAYDERDTTIVREREYTTDTCRERCQTWTILGIIGALLLLTFAYMFGKQAGYERAQYEISSGKTPVSIVR